MPSIAATLERIKQDLQLFIPEADVTAACREAGHRWRERKCGPVKTIHLFLLQVLCFNTAMTHLRLLAKAAVAAPAYCRARMPCPWKYSRNCCGVPPSPFRPPPLRKGGADCGRCSWTAPAPFPRHAGVAEGIWPARRTEARLWFSHTQSPWAIRRSHGPDLGVVGFSVADARAVESLETAPAVGTGRSAGRRPRPVFVRPHGHAGRSRRVRLVPHASAANRRFSPASSGAVGKPKEGDDRARTETTARQSVPVGKSQGDGKAGRRRANL